MRPLVVASMAGLAVFVAGTLLIWSGTRDSDRRGDDQDHRSSDTAFVIDEVLEATVIASPTVPPTPLPTATPVPTSTAVPTPTPTPTPELWSDVRASGEPWGAAVAGVLTFRGSPTRSYYGEGPVPSAPERIWSYPSSAMCSLSSVGSETTQWCGTGWTGQPAVWERDGGLWVAFGAYDRKVHVIDGVTGEPRFAPFVTGDLIKGSVTIDPDGHPLIYFGSRDNQLRVVSFDRGELVELWSLDARSIEPRLWNDDWDGAPILLGDHLIEGGENSNLHVVKLNRAYNADGMVTVDPELLAVEPGWDDELLAAVGSNVSIENSVAVAGSIVYFSNSGGLVQGWDLAGLADGLPPVRVFRWWAGDDVDASIVIDDEAMLYVGVEYERGNDRSREVGQLIKLDPSRDDPLIWSIADRGRLPAGIWATPAVTDELVVASTDTGRLIAVDRETGEILWEKRSPLPLWSSQVVVDDVLIQADCEGWVRAYDLTEPRKDPPLLWEVELGGCIESTPVVWKGRIWVGTRAGRFHLIADPIG